MRAKLLCGILRPACASLFCVAIFGVAVARTAPRQPQSSAIASADDPRLAKFVYDQVSITPPTPDKNIAAGERGETRDGLTLRAIDGTSVGFLMFSAYRQPGLFVVQAGKMNSPSNQNFDLQARMKPDVADALANLSPAEQKFARQHMLRVLLTDYFKVEFHRERNRIPIYEVFVATGGSKLRPVTDANVPDGKIVVTRQGDDHVWEAHAVPMAALLQNLSLAEHRPMGDYTGLTGRYDFTLRFAVEDKGDPAEPVARAIQKQLGLKLVPATAMQDRIVVDHAELPWK